MASKTKKSTAKANKTSTKPRVKKKTPPPDPGRPVRREAWAAVFAFLALFVIISYFVKEGSFIIFFSDLIKGLIGWGYWVMAADLALVAYILFFHKGKPVGFRMFCAFMLPVFFSAIMHLFYADVISGKLRFTDLSSRLFEGGQKLQGGGLIGGLLSRSLYDLLSIYGAFAVFAILFIVFFFIAIDTNPFIKKEKTESSYTPEKYAELSKRRSERTSALIEKARQTLEAEEKNSRTTLDIPLTDDDEPLDLPSSNSGVSRVRVRKKAPVFSNNPDDFPDDLDPDMDRDIEVPDIQIMPKLGDSEGPGLDEFDFLLGKDEEPLEPALAVNKPKSRTKKTPAKKPEETKVPELEIKDISEKPAKAEVQEKPVYVFPPTSLLSDYTASGGETGEYIRSNKVRLERALASFGINSPVTSVTNGPTVTRYDIELEQGLKLSRVTNLSEDIALSLGVEKVRIAPVPNKISTVGIEVPNQIPSTVFLREIIESDKFRSARSRLTFALGKDIAGECMTGNIAKLPHLLIAGTTGSGKSVCINCLLLSLIYKATPDEVKFILIDPKMVELGVYNKIPHLYTDVVTDPKKASGALQWSVVEMLKRYRLFADEGVRDLETYNSRMVQAGEEAMPQVVIVIDELADLMMAASKEVEESICRIAQMGRAAGIHLVVATQRPSSDVITGLMKANIPSRIAFSVASAMESRIIMDQSGAEKLLGKGDMLFSPIGAGKPVRIQGAYVSDEEREDVIKFIKKNNQPQAESVGEAVSELADYMNKAAEDKSAPEKSDEPGLASEYDDMLPQAVDVALEVKQVSVSMLQRRLKLGYSRAARIVDQMEELGIVGPYEGAKPRQVIVDREGWKEIEVSMGLISDADMDLALDMQDDSENFNYSDEEN